MTSMNTDSRVLRNMMRLYTSGPREIGYLRDDFAYHDGYDGICEALLQSVSSFARTASLIYKTTDVSVALMDTNDGHTQAFIGVIPHGGGRGFKISSTVEINETIWSDETTKAGKDMKKFVDEAGGVVYFNLASGERRAMPATHGYMLSNYDYALLVVEKRNKDNTAPGKAA